MIFEIEELCRRFEIKELYQRGDPSVEELIGDDQRCIVRKIRSWLMVFPNPRRGTTGINCIDDGIRMESSTTNTGRRSWWNEIKGGIEWRI